MICGVRAILFGMRSCNWRRKKGDHQEVAQSGMVTTLSASRVALWLLLGTASRPENKMSNLTNTIEKEILPLPKSHRKDGCTVAMVLIN